MTSMPCLSHHSSSMNDIPQLYKNQTQNPLVAFTSNPNTTTVLQYFNKRVTQRLHHYRSMKRQWQEVATSVQSLSSVPSANGSSTHLTDLLPITQDAMKNLTISKQKSVNESKAYCINDYINTTTLVRANSEGTSMELDPLHSKIQQDLIKLRKLVRKQQKQFNDNTSLLTFSTARPLGELVS